MSYIVYLFMLVSMFLYKQVCWCSTCWFFPLKSLEFSIDGSNGITFRNIKLR